MRLERGSLEVSKEMVRSGGWESVVEACWQDLRFALAAKAATSRECGTGDWGFGRLLGRAVKCGILRLGRGRSQEKQGPKTRADQARMTRTTRT